VPPSKAALVAPAVELGFGFHHAEPGYLMLTQWLPKDEASPLPPNASTQVGVGAFVLNAEGKILLVQEKFGPLKGKGVWKIPTGLADAGEDVADACVRECREETGIEAVFESVVAFRHAHGFMAGKSDVFFVCILRAKSSKITIQPAEIEAAKWGGIEEFLDQAPYPRDTPIWSRLYSLARDVAEGKAMPLLAESHELVYRPGSNMMYCNTPCVAQPVPAKEVVHQV
jgi:ADP-ribose pyrophosphatase YjhB (NUDIX family)